MIHLCVDFGLLFANVTISVMSYIEKQYQKLGADISKVILDPKFVFFWHSFDETVLKRILIYNIDERKLWLLKKSYKMIEFSNFLNFNKKID